MADKRVIVAIDGPAGAGKSTLAKRLADKLGFRYLDTGAMYRAIALWSLRLKIPSSDMHRLEQLANEANIELAEGQRVLLNGEDVTGEIRSREVSNTASQIAAIPAVRRALVRHQRAMAEKASLIAEGRDVGSVVFPTAQVKIFLDAHADERVRRRALELRKTTGSTPDVATLTGEITQRDHRDRTRTEAPLVQAPDAELVDTTNLSLDEVENVILKIIRARISNGKEVAPG